MVSHQATFVYADKLAYPMSAATLSAYANASAMVEVAHKTLGSAIQLYLEACTSLEALSRRPLQPHDKLLFERMAQRIDDTILPEAIENEKNLALARTRMTQARNRSSALVPISKLLVECLSDIFLLSKSISYHLCAM
jgi:hypothetical protein